MLWYACQKPESTASSQVASCGEKQEEEPDAAALLGRQQGHQEAAKVFGYRTEADSITQVSTYLFVCYQFSLSIAVCVAPL